MAAPATAQQAVFLGMILLCGFTASASEEAGGLAEAQGRTIIVDGGSTDSFSVTDVLLYIGTLTLASLTALLILGLIYDKKGDDGAAASYEAPTAGYTAYEQAYAVARTLYDGYNKFSDKKQATM